MPTRIRTVTFAKVVRAGTQATVFERSFAEDIVNAISPDVRIRRYGRLWRVSKPRELDGFVAAKLGFERTGRGHAVSYDERVQDFVVMEQPSEQGNFVHFVIDLPRQVLAFEEKPPDIKRQSFLGALSALLNQSQYQFEIQPLPDLADFQEWLQTVDRVVRFHAVLKRPNPEWRERTQKVRELIESTGADQVALDARVNNPQQTGLEVQKSILGDAVEHAGGGYAKVVATGVDEDKIKRFNSAQNIRSTEIEESPDEDSESIFQKIIRTAKELLL